MAAFEPLIAFLAIFAPLALAGVLDAMSDERLGSRHKLGVLLSVWKHKRAQFDRGRNSGP